MSRRPASRPPANRSTAPADRPAPARPHVVDRALAVHRLRAAGHSAAEVGRRLRVSKSTVSVLGYLGAALAGMEPESVAELRTPAVTARAVWALATRARTAERAARRDGGVAPDAAARETARRGAVVALRAALRDQVVQARLAGGDSAGRGRATGRRASGRSAAARAVGWSHAAWADDPGTFASAHLAALAAAHAHIAERAARTVALAGAERAVAGQVTTADEGNFARLGGRQWRALAEAARHARTPGEERALAVLAVLTRKLREAADDVARLTAVNCPPEPPSGAPAAASTDWIGWAEVEADLAE